MTESTSIKALSQGLGAALEGGLVAAGVSLGASVVASRIVQHSTSSSTAPKDGGGGGGYLATAAEAVGHLGNVSALFLPKSLQGLSDIAGTVATAGGGIAVAHSAVDDDDDELDDDDEEDDGDGEEDCDAGDA